MKLALPGALHARPASLLVRLVSRHTSRLELWKGASCADGRKIMDLLALGAAKGDEIELRAEGDDAALLLAAVTALIDRNFDADLVPELGSAAVEGIAFGRALVVARAGGARRSERRLDADGELATDPPAVREERRVRVALAQAAEHLKALIAALPEDEARLFEPEEAILRELEVKVLAAVRGGASAEEAVHAATEPAVSDLLLDARARVLDVLAGEDLFGRIGHPHHRDDDDEHEDLEAVLVTAQLTPTLVARLPEYVQGIVAARPSSDDGGAVAEGRANTYASHAAILARARSLPLAIVPPQVALAIAEGDPVLLDTTGSPARVWVAPSDALMADARSRRDHLARTSYEAEQLAAHTPLAVPVDLLVNIGTARERVPAGASGVGLLRTELLFAGRRQPPSVREQARLLAAVLRGARGGVVTVRLFDAADDKPLAWLPAETGARGIGLLLQHPEVLVAQLAAIQKAADVAWRGTSVLPPQGPGRVQVLLPYTRSPAEIRAVRAQLEVDPLGAPLAVGAMIESPDAVDAIDGLAAASDFVCIGTNDLAAAIAGTSRIALSRLDATLVRLVSRVVERAHHHGRTVTVCGELAAHALAAPVFVGLGVDALSVAPSRLSQTRLALRGVTLDQCREAAREAMA